jgi:hypothetical protein
MSRVRSRSGKATTIDRLCRSIRQTYKALSPKGQEEADREIKRALRGESSLGGLDPGGWKKFGELSNGHQETLSPRRNRTSSVPKLARDSVLC